MSEVIKVGMADLNVCKAPDDNYDFRSRFLYWTGSL